MRAAQRFRRQRCAPLAALAFHGAALLGSAIWATEHSTPEVAAAEPPSRLHACHGERRALTISSHMPYYLASLGSAQGYFVLDFGTTGSTVDLRGFSDGGMPRPLPGTTDRFDGFEFYGSWGTVRLAPQDHSHITGTVRQAGILGTDFLANHVFTLDYESGAVYRADAKSFCNDTTLNSAGFRATSTAGYYAFDLAEVRDSYPRVPTVPVRIGSVAAVAQLDTGFDDSHFRHSVNINRAFFDAMRADGIRLVAAPGGASSLSTCVVGETERMTRYRLPTGLAFEILGLDGKAIVAAADAAIFLKETPPAARRCGGIGTWTVPAAQAGASFYVDAKRVIFDPFRSLVWWLAEGR